MRKLLIALVSVALMAMPARADEAELETESMTFRDDYVRFEYPKTDHFLNIAETDMSYSKFYAISTQPFKDTNDYSCVYITINKRYRSGFYGEYNSETGKPEVPEGMDPPKEYAPYTGEHNYMVKELFTYGDDPEGYQICHDIYASIEPLDAFWEDYLKLDNMFYEPIYCTYKCSDRICEYIRQAIAVCDQFLAGSITSYEMNGKLDNLHDSAEKYHDASGSNYQYDFKAVLALFSNYYSKDGDVIDFKHELEEFLE